MKAIAIKRLHLLPLPEGRGISASKKCVLQAELASMGYRLSNPQLLDRASEAFFLNYTDTMLTLKAMRGGDVDYVPLFSGFPDRVPDDKTYFAQRILGFVGNVLGLFKEGTELDNGTRIPEWLFDLREFGADPVTQFQDRSLWEVGAANQKTRLADETVHWIDLKLVFEEEIFDHLQTWLCKTLYANASVKTELHDDLRELLSWFGAGVVDASQITQKENLALVMRLLWQEGFHEDAAELAQTATDLLRLFAALTDSDISLAGTITFPKFSRPQRRAVLGALEKQRGLAENLADYRGLWLEIGRYLHVSEFRKTHPRTHRAFDRLRNGKIETFNSVTEKLIVAGKAPEAVEHLKQRPGVFARKLHELLRRFTQKTDLILEAFEEIAETMTAKNLLVLLHYFQSINDLDYRAVVNKRGKLKVLDNNAQGALDKATIGKVIALIQEKLTHVLAEKESWTNQSVWIDPDLENYPVPLQQRAASDGLLTYARGSQIPIEEGNVLRLFVYWKETQRRTDLDLSLIQFTDDFKYRGHVSYTNLKSTGIVHSGDIQSAPHGAAEFIDVTLDRIAPQTRYLAVQVYRYSGETFGEMTAHAGWMVRDRVDPAYRSFDIKTVVNKFDLNGSGGYSFPLVIDLETRRVVWTDLYMGSKTLNNVEGAYGNVAQAVKAVTGFRETRPTLKSLADLHLAARQGQASEEPLADIRFGISGCTYNAHDTATILADLL